MEGKKFLYSNSVQIANNLYDFQFTFSTKSSIKNDVFDVDEPMIVAMSPTHAKIFQKILDKQICEYEKSFGEINLPTPGTQQSE